MEMTLTELPFESTTKNRTMGIPRKRLAVIGDGACGKTSLLIVFARGVFPVVEGKQVELELIDTAGQCEYEGPRQPLGFQDADVVLICFSIDSPDGLDNVEEKWIQEVSRFNPGVPVLVVGCKKDLRHEPRTIEELRRTRQHPVTPEEAAVVAQKVDAKYYLECSAKTGEGVQEVFQYATKVALLSSVERKDGLGTSCAVM